MKDSLFFGVSQILQTQWHHVEHAYIANKVRAIPLGTDYVINKLAMLNVYNLFLQVAKTHFQIYRPSFQNCNQDTWHILENSASGSLMVHLMGLDQSLNVRYDVMKTRSLQTMSVYIEDVDLQ